nr:60S ribosomal protein L5 [Cryptomonas paramecium]
MKFTKILKNNSYFSRFQVKWKRRRNGKTDYYSRKKMISKDKRKHNFHKYRVVVRFSKHSIICQFINSKFEGDRILNSVYSNKLKKMGIYIGLTNFSCAYISGLLLSKEVLKKNCLNGGYYLNTKHVIKKMKTCLDIGLTRATKGHKVFSCMKGVIDGGIEIPHKKTKYPGYTEKKNFNQNLLQERIRGKHVYDYSIGLKEEDELKFNRHFSTLSDSKVSLNRYKDLYSSLIYKIQTDSV